MKVDANIMDASYARARLCNKAVESGEDAEVRYEDYKGNV